MHRREFHVHGHKILTSQKFIYVKHSKHFLNIINYYFSIKKYIFVDWTNLMNDVNNGICVGARKTKSDRMKESLNMSMWWRKHVQRLNVKFILDELKLLLFNNCAVL